VSANLEANRVRGRFPHCGGAARSGVRDAQGSVGGPSRRRGGGSVCSHIVRQAHNSKRANEWGAGLQDIRLYVTTLASISDAMEDSTIRAHCILTLVLVAFRRESLHVMMSCPTASPKGVSTPAAPCLSS